MPTKHLTGPDIVLALQSGPLADRIKLAKSLFLKAYAETGTIHGACARVPGVYDGSAELHWDTIDAWQEVDRDFRQSVKRARKVHGSRLYAIAQERVSEPKGNRGSDWMLSRLMEWADPETYPARPQARDDTVQDSFSLLRTEAKRILKTMADGSSVQEESITTERRSRPEDLQANDGKTTSEGESQG